MLGYWPMQQLINPGAPLVTWSPGGSAVVRAVVDGPGPMRPSRTRSRMERACTHWKCTFCKAEWALSLELTVCGSCGGVRRQLGNADAEAREMARLQQRSNSAHGRRLNAQSTAGRMVPRMPQGVFDEARFVHLARLQTGLLERAAGKPQYVTHQDYLVGVMESYFIVHHLARVGLMDEAKRRLIGAAEVADFFNVIGHRSDENVLGQTVFPMRVAFSIV